MSHLVLSLLFLSVVLDIFTPNPPSTVSTTLICSRESATPGISLLALFLFSFATTVIVILRDLYEM